ncbi:MAG: glycosyltransferase [Phycisphaerales bacterium]
MSSKSHSQPSSKPGKSRIQRVAVLSTHATNGGAARSALRHHEALRSIGIDSTMVTMQPQDANNTIKAVHSISEAGSKPSDPDNTNTRHADRLQLLINRGAIDSNRTNRSTTWFSWPLFGHDLTALPAIQNADAISIHWISGMLSMNQFESLFTLGKPVLLTLHDEWMLTGGCHYTAGCAGFKTDCKRCPQLAQDPVGVTAQVLERRISHGLQAQGTVVTPSVWLGEQSSQSAALGSWNHEVIPYACDLETFAPKDAQSTREKLKLDDDRIWLMFIADDLSDRRKGFDLLAQALESINHAKDQFGIVFVGAGEHIATMFGVPTRSAGRMESSAELALIYNACDALVLPSREDNLPNTMIEALACGIPVIGSNIGGIPDCVLPESTGQLFESGRAESLAQVLSSISKASLQNMSKACRSFAERTFDPKAHAQSWVKAAEATEISNDFKPLPDTELIDAACRLSEIRATRNRSLRELSPESDAMHGLELQVQDIARRLQESENDRSQRLEHIYELHQTITDLTQSRDQNHAHIDQLSKRITSALEQFTSSHELHNQQLAQQIHHQLSPTTQAIQKSTHTFEHTQQSLTDQIAEKSAAIQALKSSIELHEYNIGGLKVELQNHEVNADRIKQEHTSAITDLQTKLDTSEKESQRALQETKLHAQKRHDELQAINQKLQSQVDKLSTESNNTQHALQQSQHAHQQSEEELQVARQQIETTHAELEESKATVAHLSAALDDLRKQHHELQLYVEQTLIAKIKRKLREMSGAHPAEQLIASNQQSSHNSHQSPST